MSQGRWSDDEFLDGLRRTGDSLADAAVGRLQRETSSRDIGQVFRMLQANDTPLPEDAPHALKVFMAASAGLPPDVDLARLHRGGTAFLRHALPSVVVLLASSLPRGYAAPCLSEVLSISHDLQRHPYDRLMGVVQLLVNISDGDAFQPNGRAIVTAQKLRLLHAGIRAMTARYRPHYQERFGMPVNHEDMLATIMAFSYLLVDGIRRLGLDLASEEADDLYYVWRVFALLMGLHPADRPHDDSLIPATLAEAGEFYTSYVRRTNTMPDRNPYGVVLTTGNLRMMEGLLPRIPRLLGLKYAPRICMTELLTREELARVGAAPLTGHRTLAAVLTLVLSAGQWTGEHSSFAARLAHLLLQGMVDVDRRGQVSFSIPFSRLDLHGPAFE